MKTLRFILFLILLLSLPRTPFAADTISMSSPMTADVMEILSQLSDQPDIRIAGEPVHMPEELFRFYAERDYRPLWSTEDTQGRERIRALMKRFEADGGKGHCDSDYHLGFFRTLFSRFTIEELNYGLPRLRWSAWYDVLLTDALFHYARHLAEGRVQPDAVQPGWNLRKRTVDLVDLVSRTSQVNDLDALLQNALPTHRGYLVLQRVLDRYREIEAFGGWSKLPPGEPLRLGMTDARVALLRTRLLLSGDMPELPAADSLVMEALDVAALKRFQRRYGLTPDGVLGEQTVEKMNVPVEERVRQIELNMERWRWLPQDLGKKYLLVNIADFTAKVIDDGKSVLSIPVVVGNQFRKTPVFSARMTYIDFAPYWYVPPTILEKDKLPLIKANPAYVARHHFEIVAWNKQTVLDPAKIDWKTIDAEHFPGILRQKPGPWNPLGRVKFMLPNPYAIYLHDTNERWLFDKSNRQFSSGCIRLKYPRQLAQFLLAGQGWDERAVAAALASGSPLRVDLKQPLPVHVLYWTAWVDENDAVNFRDDVYGRDEDLVRALSRRESGCRLASPGPVSSWVQ